MSGQFRKSKHIKYLIDYADTFMKHGKPDQEVIHRTKLFHTDAVFCGLLAIGLQADSTTLFRNEALDFKKTSTKKKNKQKFYSKMFGSNDYVPIEKAILANCSAISELNMNGSFFGYNPNFPDHGAGENTSNDFYPVVVAAASQNQGLTGGDIVKGMILLDEIRSGLAELFKLRELSINPVINGAIASCITFGKLIEASSDQIELALNLMITHYIPFNANFLGNHLGNSSKVSSAMAAEMAILCLRRVLAGLIQEDTRNLNDFFHLLDKHSTSKSPFLAFSLEGNDFSIMKQYFRFGSYDVHASSAIHGLLKFIFDHPKFAQIDMQEIFNIHIIIYEEAYKKICGDNKWKISTIDSAYFSLPFILAILLRKILSYGDEIVDGVYSIEDLWKKTMLCPSDFTHENLQDKYITKLLSLITVEYGGERYDLNFPKQIPCAIRILYYDDLHFEKCMTFPGLHKIEIGHFFDLLNYKFDYFGSKVLEINEVDRMIFLLQNLENLSNQEINDMYQCKILNPISDDEEEF
jgi:2-methylcitrate dehydratase